MVYYYNIKQTGEYKMIKNLMNKLSKAKQAKSDLALAKSLQVEYPNESVSWLLECIQTGSFNEISDSYKK